MKSDTTANSRIVVEAGLAGVFRRSGIIHLASGNKKWYI